MMSSGRGRRRGGEPTPAAVNRGEPFLPSVQQPGPAFPAAERTALPLACGEEAEYLLALKQEFRGAMKTLPSFTQTDAAAQRSHAGGPDAARRFGGTCSAAATRPATTTLSHLGSFRRGKIFGQISQRRRADGSAERLDRRLEEIPQRNTTERHKNPEKRSLGAREFSGRRRRGPPVRLDPRANVSFGRGGERRRGSNPDGKQTSSGQAGDEASGRPRGRGRPKGKPADAGRRGASRLRRRGRGGRGGEGGGAGGGGRLRRGRSGGGERGSAGPKSPAVEKSAFSVLSVCGRRRTTSCPTLTTAKSLAPKATTTWTKPFTDGVRPATRRDLVGFCATSAFDHVHWIGEILWPNRRFQSAHKEQRSIVIQAHHVNFGISTLSI
ncbi:uncharacterized protein LOC144072689 isoform X2 [Stigmatopora argus]